MNELGPALQTLRQPEYVHVLLNPMPVYGLACGVLGLIVAMIEKSRAAHVVSLVIVLVSCASVWPVVRTGHRGYDRVYSLSDGDGQQWLAAHADRAGDGQYVYYATGLLALVTILVPWKLPRTGVLLLTATLLCSLAALATGVWISHAGGQVRHREFRNGPAPKIEQHQE